ncbi:MAG: hypothetical protein RLY97_1745 [Pseudomonadota bacterium]
MRYTLLLSFAILATPAYAQSASEIIVTGRGLAETPAAPAYSNQTLTRDQLTTTASGRLEDALANIAGFQQFRRSDSRAANPSAQGVTLRGIGGNASSRALLTLDGVPQADPFFGAVAFSALDPETIGTIRITRGGGSGAFGAGALAGTIALTSANRRDIASINAQISANHTGDTSLSASLAPVLGAGYAIISGNWQSGNGYFTTPISQRSAASVPASYHSWAFGIRGVTPISPSVELQTRISLFDDRRRLRFAGADSAAAGQDASIRLIGRGSWGFEALAYVQSRGFRNVVISSTTFRPTLDQYRTPSTGLGGKLELRPTVGGNHTLRLGVDSRIDSGTAYETAFNASSGAITARRHAGGRNSDLGLFFDDDWRLGALTLTAGLRADHWSISGGNFTTANAAGTSTSALDYPNRSGSQVSYRSGALWQLGGGLALRAAAYSGLRLPTLNELYRSFTVFPVTTSANVNLRPERLAGYEAGLDYAPSPHLTMALTAYDNRVHDAIANVTIALNQRQRMNIEAIHAYGIEASFQLSAGAVSLDGSASWTKAKVEASGTASALNGLRPAQTPQFSASGTLSWRHTYGLISATLRHIGAQYEDDLQSDILPPATTLGLYAEWRMTRNIQLVLRGENVFDAEIITRNQAGSLDLGQPRTVWFGFKVRS